MQTDLFLLNKLSQIKDKLSGGGGEAIPGYLPVDSTIEPVQDDRPMVSIHSTNTRGSNPSGTWNSALNGTNFAVYSHDYRGFFFPSQSTIQNSVHAFQSAQDPNHHEATTGVAWASGGMTGSDLFIDSQNYSTSYSPIMSRIMFIKNTTDAAISWTPYVYYSSQYSSGYDGVSATVYTPNNPNFTDVTSVARNNVHTYTSTAWRATSACSAISIPANTTIAITLLNSCNSWTNTYNIYWVYGHNGFYNLQSMPAGLECDLKATQAYLTMRVSDYSSDTTKTEADVVKFFNYVGNIYGNNGAV